MGDLVQIYSAPNKSIADLMKGLLEGNSIKTLIRPAYIGIDGSGGHFGGAAEVASGPWRVYVFKEKEEEAKKLIKDYEKKD